MIGAPGETALGLEEHRHAIALGVYDYSAITLELIDGAVAKGRAIDAVAVALREKLPKTALPIATLIAAVAAAVDGLAHHPLVPRN